MKAGPRYRRRSLKFGGHAAAASSAAAFGLGFGLHPYRCIIGTQCRQSCGDLGGARGIYDGFSVIGVFTSVRHVLGCSAASSPYSFQPTVRCPVFRSPAWLRQQLLWSQSSVSVTGSAAASSAASAAGSMAPSSASAGDGIEFSKCIAEVPSSLSSAVACWLSCPGLRFALLDQFGLAAFDQPLASALFTSMITVFGNRTPLTSQSSRIRRRVHSLAGVVTSLVFDGSVASVSLRLGEVAETTMSGAGSARADALAQYIYACRKDSEPLLLVLSFESSAFTTHSSRPAAGRRISRSPCHARRWSRETACTEEPGPALLGWSMPSFLSSPVGLAPLLQNTGHQAVKPRLISGQSKIAKLAGKHNFSCLFSLGK